MKIEHHKVLLAISLIPALGCQFEKPPTDKKVSPPPVTGVKEQEENPRHHEEQSRDENPQRIDDTPRSDVTNNPPSNNHDDVANDDNSNNNNANTAGQTAPPPSTTPDDDGATNVDDDAAHTDDVTKPTVTSRRKAVNDALEKQKKLELDKLLQIFADGDNLEAAGRMDVIEKAAGSLINYGSQTYIEFYQNMSPAIGRFLVLGTLDWALNSDINDARHKRITKTTTPSELKLGQLIYDIKPPFLASIDSNLLYLFADGLRNAMEDAYGHNLDARWKDGAEEKEKAPFKNLVVLYVPLLQRLVKDVDKEWNGHVKLVLDRKLLSELFSRSWWFDQAEDALKGNITTRF